ncbi:hypothetical protein BDN71DRAFT_1586515 [Pleurotus eryngii]|uniref:Uncharacterized protein n=1 Tax=Pleurotus eryngii TaxID=5323 RepID=A0A9P6A5A8_PLEER|nr:hypothetical protein BDN71DRAFT_1586515 [Pleurotus eryngii]
MMASAGPKNAPTAIQSKIATLALRKVRKLNSQVKELAQRCTDLESVVAQAEAEARLANHRPTIPTQSSTRNKLSKKRKVSGAERRASRTDNDRRSALLGAYVASLRVERASRLMNTLAKRRASDAIGSGSRNEDADEMCTTEGGIGSHSHNVPTTGAEGYTMGCELKRSVFLDRESTSGTRS